MKQNFLLIITGLPASGKSTFSDLLKSYLEDVENVNRKISIIDPDEIRRKISPGTFDFERESEVREQNLKKVNNKLKKGNIVISDDLNYYTSMRHDLKLIADKLKKKHFIIHINTPLETCLGWNKERGEPIPNYLIKEISQKFDSFTNYSWEEPIMTVNMKQVQDLESRFDRLVKRIEQDLRESPEREKKAKETKTRMQKFNETLEEDTRKIVGELLKKPKNQKRKKKLLEFRKKFVKNHINDPFTISDISPKFKKQLRKKLGIKIKKE